MYGTLVMVQGPVLKLIFWLILYRKKLRKHEFSQKLKTQHIFNNGLCNKDLWKINNLWRPDSVKKGTKRQQPIFLWKIEISKKWAINQIIMMDYQTKPPEILSGDTARCSNKWTSFFLIKKEIPLSQYLIFREVVFSINSRWAGTYLVSKVGIYYLVFTVRCALVLRVSVRLKPLFWF